MRSDLGSSTPTISKPNCENASLWVRRHLAFATCHGDIDKSSSINHSFISTPLGRFLLFGGLHLSTKELLENSGYEELMEDITFGVCDLTLPARARDPWTFPMASRRGFGVCSEGKEDGSGLRFDTMRDMRDDLLQVGWLWAAAVADDSEVREW